MRDPRIAILCTSAVALHAVIATIHYTGHSDLDIEMTATQNAFIGAVILAAPIVAALLLWTKLIRFGAILLAAFLVAALLFGVYHHYVAISPDHVANVPPGEMRRVFRLTAFLLPLSQAFGVGTGIWGFMRSGRAPRQDPAERRDRTAS